VPHGVPNGSNGLDCPVVYDENTFLILRTKLAKLHAAMGCELLLENGSFSAPLTEGTMTEPQFLNRLYSDLGCSTLLDLHNLYLSWRDGGPDPMDYLEELNPACVREIHLGRGDLGPGFYGDSHSDATPHLVWTYACSIAPMLTNLRAITFEFHESYFEKIRLEGIIRELEKIQILTEAVNAASPFVNVC
jgi:uncharacterized protein (UPF0276 family)